MMNPFAGLAGRLALVLVVLTVLAHALSYHIASNLRSSTIGLREVDKVKTMAGVIEPRLAQEYEHARLIALLVKGQIGLMNYVPRQGEMPTPPMTEALNAAYRDAHADMMELTDAAGVVVYRVQEPGRRGDQPSHWGIEEALAGQSGLVSSKSPTGPMVIAVEPLVAHGKLVGTLSVGRVVGYHLILDIGRQVGGQIALIARNGEAVAYSTAWEMKPDATAIEEAFLKKIPIYRSDAVTRQTQVFLPVLIVDDAWVFVAVLDSASAFALIRTADQESLAVLFLFLGVSVVVIVLLLRYALVPLTALRLRAEQIVEELSGASQLPATQRHDSAAGRNHAYDEIGQLSQSFNTMVEALQENQRQLTANNLQLDKLNQTLDQRVRDETTKRQTNEGLLIHQSRLAAMGEMMGAIAHQWRQPLNALGLVLQNIRLQHAAGALNAESMGRMQEKAQLLVARMSTTIDDFRNFFRPDEPFNLYHALRSSADIMDGVFKNHAIKLVIDCDESLELVGMQGEFSQVVLNLLSNAKDALRDSGQSAPRIVMRAGRAGSRIHIAVEDNGGGIAPDVLNKVFEPYFTTKEEGKGAGIGLYMSTMIVENHLHGHLKVVNTDAGACFIMDFPAAGVA